MNFIKAFFLLFTKIPKPTKTKIKWFLENIKYSSKSKLRNYKNIDKSFTTGSWDSYKLHIAFVRDFYPVKKIFKAPVIIQTMYEYKAPVEDIKIDFIKQEVFKLSNSFEKSFNFENNVCLGWMSKFGKIVEYLISLDENVKKNLYSDYLIEFGPGLGLAGQLYSKLFKTKPIFFDLSEVRDLREIIFREFKKNKYYKLSEFEDFSDLNKFFKRIKKIENFSFFSTWAITETPLEYRKKFEKVVQKAKISVIISNSKYQTINNLKYLEDLSYKLPNHKYISKNLDFLENSPSYRKKHRIHVFLQKNYD